MSVPVHRLGAGCPVVSVRSDTQPQRKPRPVPHVDSTRSLPPPTDRNDLLPAPLKTREPSDYSSPESPTQQRAPGRHNAASRAPGAGTDSRAHPFESSRFARYIVRIDCRPFRRFGDMYRCCCRVGTGVKTDRDFADGDVPSPVLDACRAKRKTSVARDPSRTPGSTTRAARAVGGAPAVEAGSRPATMGDCVSECIPPMDGYTTLQNAARRTHARYLPGAQYIHDGI